jgi:hypothetical protein
MARKIRTEEFGYKITEEMAREMAASGQLTPGQMGGSTTGFLRFGILMNFTDGQHVMVWQCLHPEHKMSKAGATACAESKLAVLSAQ